MAEALARWTISDNADRDEVRSLVERLAERLDIVGPPLQPDCVFLPPHPERIVPALDEIEPGWERKGLIVPPRRPA
jgi:hypothetical protein